MSKRTATVSAWIVIAALPAGVALADAFAPALKADAVSVYVCRPDKSWFARLPAAEAPAIRIAGNALGTLPWATCVHAFAPAGEVELIAEPGKDGWAFGRFGARFDAQAGSARVFTLEIVETAPEDKVTAVQRNWIARFREIGFAEAGPGLVKLRAGESPAGR